jgi:hypothetical protein
MGDDVKVKIDLPFDWKVPGSRNVVSYEKPGIYSMTHDAAAEAVRQGKGTIVTPKPRRGEHGKAD